MGACLPNQYSLGLKGAFLLFRTVNRARYRRQERLVI